MLGQIFHQRIKGRRLWLFVGTLTLMLVLTQSYAFARTTSAANCPVYCHYCDQFGRVNAFAAPFGNDPGGPTTCSWGVCLDCGGLAAADVKSLEEIESMSMLDQFRLLSRLNTVMVNVDLSSLQLIGCDGEVAVNIPVESRRTLTLARAANFAIAN